MSKHYKILLSLTIVVATALSMLFLKSSSYNEDENAILAKSDIGTVNKTEFTVRYRDYLRRTGIEDIMPARQSILRQMVNERLLLSTIRPEITQNSEYKNEIISKRDDFLVSRYADKIIKPSISVTEEELRYRFSVESSSYHVRQLFTTTYDEAMSAKEALDSGFKFEFIASNLQVPSILESNINDLGYVKGKNLKWNALEMLAPLSVNGVTLPIKVPTGFTLLQLLDKKQNPLMTEQRYAKEIGRLTAVIRNENLTLSAKAHIDHYLESLHLEWDESILNKFHRYLNDELGDLNKPIEQEVLRGYGLSYSDNIFLNEEGIFTIADYFKWSSRFKY